MHHWKYAWLLLCLLFSAFTAAAEVFPINSECKVLLHSIEKVKTRSLEHMPKQGWQKVERLPDLWEFQPNWQHYDGGAWYRLDWGWQCQNNAQLQEPIALSLEYINSAGALYLNNDMLWRDRNLTEPLSKSWNSIRYWLLPIAGLKQDHNSIMIYVAGYADLKAGIGRVAFDNVFDASAYVQKRTWEFRTLFQINIILSGTLGIICLIIWLFRRQETSFGWFALSSLMWVCFISNVLITETAPFSNLIIASKVNIICFMLYFLAFCAYLIRFIEVRKPRLERALLALTGVFIAALCAVDLTRFQLLASAVAVFYNLLFITTYVYLCIVAVRSKRTDFIFLAICMSTIVFFALIDMLSFTMFSEASLPPLTPYTSPIVTVFIVVILGARLNRNVKKVERFNEHLAQKVHQVSRDLSASLNEKHQLEISNVRLQERIKLSHDLHDGLGASIVRSMILVDQCDHAIPNQQFLSMLKLLRDDLRQIIDSGSVEENRVPDSPVLWVAPVRYRFNLLLEEIDIRAVWQFPSEWEFVPNALQCLTLIRILEESLVNVVKHSHAEQVHIAMRFLDSQQLELTVQDNGIGFDVECVNQNGMSIGMRSMKMRATRMGGELNIESTPGSTRIQALLKIAQAA